ncbi:MAG TPA: hypothetical protein VGL03_04940 [Thermoanaerobaculia bacterium]|jgi:hypothetical protein
MARPIAAYLFLLATLVVGSAALNALYRAHADRMKLETGQAEWIWYTRQISEPRPLHFYATGGFELDSAPTRALAKVFVDRSHVLYVNGARVGSGVQKPGHPLALYDLSRLLRAGSNRIAIEAASPTGIGGILFALDLEGFGRDAFVSNGLWRVDLERSAIASGARFRAQVWGRPPQYPWGYPRMPRPNEVR